MNPEEICRAYLRFRLRGRGGGGFPTGRKWDVARRETNVKKYVICNGDEGDPGAFMDMGIMEGNPHSVIEGMTIAARAIEADEGFIYVRAEYPLAVKRLRKAIDDAYRVGLLGKSLFGSEHSFNLTIMEGAGAFVCGEETALIASIEGKRGMPSPKPPFPSISGLWGKPTIINNVETLSQVPLILAIGADGYRKRGTKESPGTKTFALTGHVANSGLIEMPFGATARDHLRRAGGMTSDTGKAVSDGFKAVQIGGPSGGCLTRDHLDLPIDFDSLKTVGAMVGSGVLVVMNKNTCMVSVARFFMQFTSTSRAAYAALPGRNELMLASLTISSWDAQQWRPSISLKTSPPPPAADVQKARCADSADCTESGPLNNEAFPRRISGSRAGQTLSHGKMQGSGETHHR